MNEDAKLLEIEARLAEVSRRRRDALTEAESLTQGFKGLVAGWRGNREARVDEAVRIAAETKAELEVLRKARERRIAELDPAKGEEFEEMEDRKRLMDRAAELRKKGGSKADMLDRLERERRSRTLAIEALEQAESIGTRAMAALEAYLARLHEDEATIGSGNTFVGTAGAEARESLASFVEKIDSADASMVLVAAAGEVDLTEELERCALNLEDVREMSADVAERIVAAKKALRPIEAAYRTLLSGAA